MQIESIKELNISDIKVIKFKRFYDHRGYFMESFRESTVKNNVDFLKNERFVQCNESFSQFNVIRGLHFQVSPPMGKLVRTISGHMVDLFLDIRPNSKTFGFIGAYDMPSENTEWIYVPPGFAHGNFFLKDTIIQYMCTGEYNKETEHSICPFSKDLNWSLCDNELYKQFVNLNSKFVIISEKDNNAQTLTQWIEYNNA